MKHSRVHRNWIFGLRMSTAGVLLLHGLVQAQTVPEDRWVHLPAELRTSFETITLPGNDKVGLVGTGYLLEWRPGLCLGPAAYGAITGQYGGLFTVGAEAALCSALVGPLRLEAGLYVGGGGGGGAPVGGGLMLRPHADLLWDFGGYRAGVSVSHVRFPSGQIHSTQVGLVLGTSTEFSYLPIGAFDEASAPGRRTGFGIDRVLGIGGAYRPASGTLGVGGAPLKASIGTVGLRADHFLTSAVFAGVEANGAASGGAAGYAEFLATVGVELPLASDHIAIGGRLALGMSGGGGIPVGGGLLGKAAVDAGLRISDDLGLNLEAGWARAPQGTFSAPFASVALRWDLDPPHGRPASPTRQEWVGGLETYHLAARKTEPAASLQNVVITLNRFVGETVYLSAQVHSAYAGGAGAFSVGLIGLGVQHRLDERWLLGAELLAGAAGGGGVATGGGAVVQPMAYVGLKLNHTLSLRLSAGQVKATAGPLNSTVFGLTVAFPFGVAG